jgi:aspartyl-tRNA synthetase
MDIPLPLKRLTYDDAMTRYGSDKPDTRFGLELVDVSDIAERSGFQVFSSVVKNGGSVRAINAKGCEDKFARRTSEYIRLSEEISDFLESLPEQQEAVLKLRYIEGWGWNRITKELHYSDKHVFYIHRQALKKLL